MTENTDKKVISIIANIKQTQNSIAENGTVGSQKNNENKHKVEEIRGMPKSGRFWKTKKERFSSINKTKGLRLDFKKKTSLRLELKRTKELSKQVQEESKHKEVERKERRRQNIKRADENKQKSEVVQVITNTAKLKRMKKKQLRFIQKRDTNKEVEASK